MGIYFSVFILTNNIDNITAVKCSILKHLPVNIYNSKTKKRFDPGITSIYFDNDNFDLYVGRLKLLKGAEVNIHIYIYIYFYNITLYKIIYYI